MTRAVGVELKIHGFLLALIDIYEQGGNEEHIQLMKKAERWYSQLPETTKHQFTAFLLRFVVVHSLQDPSVEIPEGDLSDKEILALFQPKGELAKKSAAKPKPKPSGLYVGDDLE